MSAAEARACSESVEGDGNEDDEEEEGDEDGATASSDEEDGGEEDDDDERENSDEESMRNTIAKGAWPSVISTQARDCLLWHGY